jgi:hypothetical protein
MSSFWPDGIELSDTQSPKDILNTAKEEWRTVSDGVLELVLQDAKSESGNFMIIVHAKHVRSKRTATLFSIVHEPEKPYPVRIQPEKENIPDSLKKSYYKQSAADFSLGSISVISDSLRYYPMPSEMTGLGVRPKKDMNLVSNPWVSDTPSEFRKKLSEVFNLGLVKREILNLASSAINNKDEHIDVEQLES